MTERISAAVRKAITASTLSRYELAKRSGVSESVLSRFVRGERSISLDTVDKLAEVLGLVVRQGRTTSGE